MMKQITMPAGGQTTDMSVIGSWLVKVGDQVKRGDPLLEIETDKATLTVESYAKGTVLAILAEEGDEKRAGEVIALIGDEKDMEEAKRFADKNAGGAAKKKEEETPEMAGHEEEEYQPVDLSAPIRYIGKDDRKPQGDMDDAGYRELPAGDIKAMPNAKKIAREHGVSLADVAKFAGKQTLKRWDVTDYIEHAKKSGESACEETGDRDEIIRHTTMRRVIAKRMQESAQTIPVFAAAIDVDMSACITFRRQINAAGDRKVSYHDILFKCMEAAIRKYPYVNASYTEDAMIVHRDVNIGLAVSVDGGLLVPVVKNVREKTIGEIAAINKDHVAKAREGKLSPDEMSGGTITLSNLGMYPVVQFQAIINPPEVCILALGAVEEKPVLTDGQWKSVPVMRITGSFDHRIIDGAYGAQFLGELKKIIENPALALV